MLNLNDLRVELLQSEAKDRGISAQSKLREGSPVRCRGRDQIQ